MRRSTGRGSRLCHRAWPSSVNVSGPGNDDHAEPDRQARASQQSGLNFIDADKGTIEPLRNRSQVRPGYDVRIPARYKLARYSLYGSFY